MAEDAIRPRPAALELIAKNSARGRLEKQQDELRTAVSSFEAAIGELIEAFPDSLGAEQRTKKIQRIKSKGVVLARTSARSSLPRTSSGNVDRSLSSDSTDESRKTSDDLYSFHFYYLLLSLLGPRKRVQLEYYALLVFHPCHPQLRGTTVHLLVALSPGQ